MKKNTLRHSLLLLLTAAIWGFAFVAQSVGMDYVQPFTFTADLGIPCAGFDGDQADPRNFNAAQYETRVEDRKSVV